MLHSKQYTTSMYSPLSELIGMSFLCMSDKRSRVVVDVVVAIVVCSVRAAVKRMGYERGNNTY
jgi:hypothetical protein